MTAALRARESARPDRLFDDPYAARLAGPEGEALLREFGDNVTIAIRTRHYDAKITESPLTQRVWLAAGMDSRAYRLTFPPGTRLYELDRPAVLSLKASLLPDAPACERIPVPVDLADDWVTPLREAGFDPEVPTFWLIEGLVMYLAAADVTRLLARVSEVSAAGSELLVDFAGTSLLTSPMMQETLRQYAEHDMTWRYGTDDPESLLEPLGWRPDVKMISEVGKALNRWEYPVVPRHVPGVPQGYFVHATR